MYQGKTLRLLSLGDGFVELCFDRAGEPINKLDKTTVRELREAVESIAGDPALRGLLVTSAKDVFIVGADITEFAALFALSAEDISADVSRSNQSFLALENLPVPTLSVINGYALGGGLELALSTDFRVQSTTAEIGLPEVKLGLIPGFGGTVRLPRVGGAHTALHWIVSGRQVTAEDALAGSVVDAIAEPESLRGVSLHMLRQAACGELDWRSARQRKRQPVLTDPQLANQMFQQERERLQQRGNQHLPAAQMAITLLQDALPLDGQQALELESKVFGQVARTQAASSLVQAFLNDQALKKTLRQYRADARPVSRSAVLGAGIMGGGIAYGNAIKGIDVRVKDISFPALQACMGEARRLLDKGVASARMSRPTADAALARITPLLEYEGFDDVQIVVEAVVEKLDVKREVLQGLESVVADDCVIATNTSSLCLREMADALQDSKRLVGLHFFNPVPQMPLVEVVRGEHTDQASLCTAVQYVLALGKTPIVVSDCPGFLVNRVLTPYILAFLELLGEGVDFQRIDQVMEAFGWPMGPAYLNDVVGIDTAAHVFRTIGSAYPRRMSAELSRHLDALVRLGRLGQKSGSGFYQYQRDEGGKVRKIPTTDIREVLRIDASAAEVGDQQIIRRLILPMLLEAVHCLDEGVVGSAHELDTAMTMGLGFPTHMGGPLKYIDWLGAEQVVEWAGAVGLGVPERLKCMARDAQRFY
ncbi:fatty acid oxidation complex subunit alpha FadB [Pseudomonas aeruginosa]|uniref:3-hydroxyacyl-CoA dehydrogenase NAD-binding domain-containing protein n=1 Tax=Pseudomonas aeruginosa TaxID=287 RepID=UPI000FC4321D|nr:3-hydroxyacyl-CoA dehydrogenase NAD-binding domain-containing protein [Pseudomonas aeruginosa]RUE31492.1 fatty acid oxidation complex subunit alpha FadB [Pseudomonas aeruginosa]